MSTHYSGFQCPITGDWIVATYERGMITMRVADDDPCSDESAIYCKQHTNKRVMSLEEADEYIYHVSDGQSEGFV